MHNISRRQCLWTHTSTLKLVQHKTHRHTRTNPTQVQSLIKNKHVNTDGFRLWSLSENRSNWEILIKSKLWARLESLPSLLMRACCLWNVSLHKHVCMQMRSCLSQDFTTCSIFLVTLWTWGDRCAIFSQFRHAVCEACSLISQCSLLVTYKIFIRP